MGRVPRGIRALLDDARVLSRDIEHLNSEMETLMAGATPPAERIKRERMRQLLDAS